MSEQEIEQRIQDKGLNAPRVTPSMIDALMATVTYHIHVVPGTTTTVAVAVLANGFSLAMGYSACVSVENFNAEIGASVARENAEYLARDKLWELEGYSLMKSLGQITRVCHEVNRAYCASIGDDSQPSWEDAPDWQKDSAINGVQLQIDNPDVTPEQRHESWLEEKRQAGWVYGEVKDLEAKTHYCMVAYDELPIDQRTKDYLFSAVIRAMI